MIHSYTYLRRLTWSALFASLGTGALAQAACNPATDGFSADWDRARWTTGASSGSITAEAADASRASQIIDIEFSGDTQEFLANYPIVNSSFNGGRTGQDSLAFAVDYDNNSEEVFLTIDFEEPVAHASFRIYDIDELDASFRSGGFRDAVIITATGPSGNVTPDLDTALSTAIYTGPPLPSNAALGFNGQANNNNDYGTLFVDFPAPVTQIRIEYTNRIFPPSNNPAPQGVGLSDISYCITQPEPEAELSFDKSLSLHSEDGFGCDQIPGAPDPEARFMVPGACVEYVITATNTGAGAATALEISDGNISENLIFVGAQITGFQSDGPGFGLDTPSAGADCANGCTVEMTQARLDPDTTGRIIIRATLK